jgi:pimeloyl-ACP methyl ester carboxylesterase
MPSVEAPGATLHYETFGSGPLLLLIPGADGRGSIFHDVAQFFAPCFTVICLDRRGYSKSFLKSSQDFNNRLSVDADDAYLLIQHLSNDPATVFGTSSGAIVAQRLLERHPDSVKKLIAHEPPALSVLPEEFRTQGTGLIQHVYDTYRAHGTVAAMDVFTSGLSEGSDGAVMRSCMDATRGDEIRANSMFWFEFELRQYTSAPVNVKLLEAEKGKFVPVAGMESGDGPGVGPIAVIAQKLGKKIVRTPGGHVGFMTAPEVFAEAMLKLLK